MLKTARCSADMKDLSVEVRSESPDAKSSNLRGILFVVRVENSISAKVRQHI